MNFKTINNVILALVMAGASSLICSEKLADQKVACEKEINRPITIVESKMF